MTQDYAPAILADETTTAGTIVGTGVSTTFLLFFEQSFQRMVPYIFICSIVILIDLIFGIKAAKWNIPICDVHDSLGFNMYNHSVYMNSDGAHCTSKGYEIIARKIWSFIKANEIF